MQKMYDKTEQNIGRYPPAYRAYENYENYRIMFPEATIEDYHMDSKFLEALSF